MTYRFRSACDGAPARSRSSAGPRSRGAADPQPHRGRDRRPTRRPRVPQSPPRPSAAAAALADGLPRAHDPAARRHHAAAPRTRTGSRPPAHRLGYHRNPWRGPGYLAHTLDAVEAVCALVARNDPSDRTARPALAARVDRRRCPPAGPCPTRSSCSQCGRRRGLCLEIDESTSTSRRSATNSAPTAASAGGRAGTPCSSCRAALDAGGSGASRRAAMSAAFPYSSLPPTTSITGEPRPSSQAPPDLPGHCRSRHCCPMVEHAAVPHRSRHGHGSIFSGRAAERNAASCWSRQATEQPAQAQPGPSRRPMPVPSRRHDQLVERAPDEHGRRRRGPRDARSDPILDADGRSVASPS